MLTNTDAYNNKTAKTAPKLIFIIPYRNRSQHMNFFKVMMKHVLEDYSEGSYEFCFAHQCDPRPFNRGAMKNLGFIAMKEKYPNDYKNITFVFNDVDTVPYTKNVLHYETQPGIIKHFYGYSFALGGILAINGADFERINGFPSYWSWGFEDNCLQNRALKAGLVIDRSNFFKIGNYNILQMTDGYGRMVNRRGPHQLGHDDGKDGISTIRSIHYQMNGDMANFTSFEPIHKMDDEMFEKFDLSNRKFLTNNIEQWNMRHQASSGGKNTNTPMIPVSSVPPGSQLQPKLIPKGSQHPRLSLRNMFNTRS